MSTTHLLAGQVITIDGPSASGKGTLAKRLAKRYKMKYLDTGTIYRTLTYLVLREKVDPTYISTVVKLAEEMDFDFKHVGNNQFETFLDGESIEAYIRTPQIDRTVRLLAPVTEVRDALRERQIGFANKWKDLYGVILDGRDTGGVIYPDAAIQFFVTGCKKTRAKLRYNQMLEVGIDVVEGDVLEQLERRDARDAENTIQTKRAHLLDITTHNADDIERQAVEVVEASFPIK